MTPHFKTISDALEDASEQMALLAKQPETNPWVKQLKEALTALSQLQKEREELVECVAALWPLVQSYANDHLNPQSTIHCMAQGWVDQARALLKKLRGGE